MKRQDGFGVVGILVVVVVLAVVGGAGWLVYSKTKTHNQQTTTQASTSSDSGKQAAAANTAESVLKIPELGIQLVLPEELKDMVYAKTAQGNIGLSTQALADFDSGCKPEKGGVGVIVTFKDPNGNDAVLVSGTNIESYPNAAKIGDTYYAVQFASLYQAPCASDVGVSTTETAKDKEYTSIQQKIRDNYEKITIEKL